MSEISDFITNHVEPVDVYDADGVLDGYALVVAPEWWVTLRRRYAEITDGHIARLNREAPGLKRLGPVCASYSSAWAEAERVRYVSGVGFEHFAEPAQAASR